MKNIDDFTILNNHAMISLDVSALITNVPYDLVLKGIKKRWDKISSSFDIPRDEIENAIRLILRFIFFQFNGKTYQQNESSPMGSPLSAYFAELVLRGHEKNCLEILGFKIFKYYRYVNNIFHIVPTDKIKIIRKVFNDYHKSSKFKVETLKIQFQCSL